MIMSGGFPINRPLKAHLRPAGEPGRPMFITGDGEGPFAGDAPVSSVAQELGPRQISLVIGALLQGLNPSERATAANRAVALANGPKKQVAPWLACVPEGAGVDMTRRLLNGLGMGLMALGSARSGDSADDVMARWASIASRQPFACDPTSAQSISDENLAQMILRASMISPEVADLLAKNPHFEALLKQASSLDENAGQAVDAQVAHAVYDCIQHNDPLGGDSAASEAWHDIVDKLKSGAAAAVKSAGSALADRIAGKRQNSDKAVPGVPKDPKKYALGKQLPNLLSKEKLEKAVQEAVTSSAGEADSESISKVIDYFNERLAYWRQMLDEPVQGDYVSSQAVSLAMKEVAEKFGPSVANSLTKLLSLNGVDHQTSVLTDAVAETRKALEEARAMVSRGKQSLSDYQNDLEQRAKEAARLDWAQALLDAPDDVSVMLALVTPNMTSVSGALTSAFDLFRAAKKTGSAGSLYSLIRSFVKSGALNDTDFVSSLSGDPALAEEIAESLAKTKEV